MAFPAMLLSSQKHFSIPTATLVSKEQARDALSKGPMSVSPCPKLTPSLGFVLIGCEVAFCRMSCLVVTVGRQLSIGHTQRHRGRHRGTCRQGPQTDAHTDGGAQTGPESNYRDTTLSSIGSVPLSLFLRQGLRSHSVAQAGLDLANFLPRPHNNRDMSHHVQLLCYL